MLRAVLSAELADGAWRQGAVLELDRWIIALAVGACAVAY